MTTLLVNMTDLKDKEKKLWIKMSLEEEEFQQSAPYNVTDPDEEKEREELMEKLRRRQEIIVRFLENC